MADASFRLALLRDLDDALKPFGVLYESDDGGALLRTYDKTPHELGLKSEYPDWDSALETASRNWLVSAVGQEGNNYSGAVSLGADSRG